jgi:hypothetical protein
VGFACGKSTWTIHFRRENVEAMRQVLGASHPMKVTVFKRFLEDFGGNPIIYQRMQTPSPTCCGGDISIPFCCRLCLPRLWIKEAHHGFRVEGSGFNLM